MQESTGVVAPQVKPNSPVEAIKSEKESSAESDHDSEGEWSSGSESSHESSLSDPELEAPLVSDASVRKGGYLWREVSLLFHHASAGRWLR